MGKSDFPVISDHFEDLFPEFEVFHWPEIVSD